MAWEDFGDDDRELLESCDGEARQRYWGALSRGLIIYFIAIGIVLTMLFFAVWYAFRLAG